MVAASFVYNPSKSEADVFAYSPNSEKPLYYPSFKLNESNVRSLHIMGYISENLSNKDLLTNLNSHQIVAHPLSKCYIENENQGLIFGYAAIRKHLMTKKIIETIQVYNTFSKK